MLQVDKPSKNELAIVKCILTGNVEGNKEVINNTKN